MALNTATELDGELLIEIFQTDLMEESTPNDIFDRQSGSVIYEGGKEQPELPDKMYLKLQAGADEGRSVKVPMIKELHEDPTLGSDGDQDGSEEEPDLKWFSMHYTDVSHAVTNQAFGILARDKIPYKIFEQRVPLLGRYFKQYIPVMRRQALLEGISENLEEAPHFFSTSYCPNMFIPGLEFADQPDYNVDPDEWVNNIVEAMNSAGTGSDTYASIRMIQLIEEYCWTYFYMEAIPFENGQMGFIMTVPTPVMTWLRNLAQSGNPGGVWQTTKDLPNINMLEYPNFAVQIGAMRLVEDFRYPTLTPSGSASAGGNSTLTAQYRRMGNADDGSSDPRDKTSAGRLVSYILGKHAMCEWMPEKFHWEYNYEPYDKNFGSGVFFSIGVKRVEFDIGTPTSSSMHCKGVAVVPWTLPPTTVS